MIARYLIVDWPQFAAALVLLLVPGGLFHGKKTRYREISRDWDEHWPRVFAHALHTVDLVRAALGTWLLINSLHSVTNPHGLAKYAVLFTQGSIRILAVWLQTVFCRQPDSANAPFAFVTGLLLAGISPLVAVFALALAIPLAMGSRTPAAFFPIVAIAHLAIGFWFKGKGAVLALSFGASAAMVPLLWAMLFRRELVLVYRAKRLADDHQPEPLR
jgi:hypothetical protein